MDKTCVLVCMQVLEKDDPVLAWLKRILAKYEGELKDVLWAWEL